MSRVIHFEIPSDNPDKAQQFYATVFGWKMTQWADQPYWLCSTGDKSKPGIDGAIIKSVAPIIRLLIQLKLKNLMRQLKLLKQMAVL